MSARYLMTTKSHRILNVLTPDGAMDINFIENVEVEIVDRPFVVNEVMNLYRLDKIKGKHQLNTLDKLGRVYISPYDSEPVYTAIEITRII